LGPLELCRSVKGAFRKIAQHALLHLAVVTEVAFAFDLKANWSKLCRWRGEWKSPVWWNRPNLKLPRVFLLSGNEFLLLEFAATHIRPR